MESIYICKVENTSEMLLFIKLAQGKLVNSSPPSKVPSLMHICNTKEGDEFILNQLMICGLFY